MAEKEKKPKNGKGRTRNYATIVYPESAPPDWLQKLREMHIPAFVSPLHDKDTNPDGTPKKAHHHVLIMFDSVKTQEQADEVFAVIGGVGHEDVKSTRGYARYLWHADNPEKYQYEKSEVVSLGGADLEAVVTLASDDDAEIDEMTRYIERNHIYSFRKFASFCRDSRPEWSRLIKHQAAYYIKEFIKGLAWDETDPKASEQDDIRKAMLKFDEQKAKIMDEEKDEVSKDVKD